MFEFFLIILCVFTIVFYKNSIETSFRIRWIKSDSMFEQTIEDSFDFTKGSVSIIKLMFENNLPDFTRLESIQENCSNVLKYQGPKCLDGTPDMRFKTWEYGYSHTQEMSYKLFLLNESTNKKVDYLLLGESYEGKVSTYSAGKNSSFKGLRVLDISNNKTVAEVNFFIFCLSSVDLKSNLDSLFCMEKNKLAIIANKHLLVTDLGNINNKIEKLNALMSNMSDSELIAFNDLKNKYTEKDKELNLIIENIAKIEIELNKMHEDTCNWVKNNKISYVEKAKNKEVSREINDLLNNKS